MTCPTRRPKAFGPGRLPGRAVGRRGGAQRAGRGRVTGQEQALAVGLVGEGLVERRLVRPTLGQGVT